MPANLTIGDFSQLTHLSIKTLRRYHEAALLEPDEVDARTGYRYYTVDQIPTAQVIHRFRTLGMPVREIGEVLSTDDPVARAALIERHLDRLETQLDETRAAVTSLRRLLQPDPPPLAVLHRREEATTVAAVRATVERGEVLAWYSDAMSDLYRAFEECGLQATGPAGGRYDNELFTRGPGRSGRLSTGRRPTRPEEQSNRSSSPRLSLPSPCIRAHMTTLRLPTALSAPTSPHMPWRSPGRCTRCMSSGHGTPTTAQPGAPKSAGRSSTPRRPRSSPLASRSRSPARCRNSVASWADRGT